MLSPKANPFYSPDKEELRNLMTLDEARLMVNVNARARRLFEDGYRARWVGPHLLAVRNSNGGVYRIDTTTNAYACPFFLQSGHPCKHSLGWRRLLARQRTCRPWLGVLLLRAWRNLDDDPRGKRAPDASRLPHQRGDCRNRDYENP
jgi:hypothetical protein